MEDEKEIIKKVFLALEKELYHRDKTHFEFNSHATFKRLEHIRQKMELRGLI